jgi:hypothetical protein
MIACLSVRLSCLFLLHDMADSSLQCYFYSPLLPLFCLFTLIFLLHESVMKFETAVLSCIYLTFKPHKKIDWNIWALPVNKWHSKSRRFQYPLFTGVEDTLMHWTSIFIYTRIYKFTIYMCLYLYILVSSDPQMERNFENKYVIWFNGSSELVVFQCSSISVFFLLGDPDINCLSILACLLWFGTLVWRCVCMPKLVLCDGYFCSIHLNWISNISLHVKNVSWKTQELHAKL